MLWVVITASRNIEFVILLLSPFEPDRCEGNHDYVSYTILNQFKKETPKH